MFADLLRERLAGIADLSEIQVAQLEAHYDLLKKWNQVLNLTRIDDLAEAVERHYCESLFLAAHLPSDSFRIADIGSGGGFPGIPVAITRPDCSVTLIESHQRKAVFLKEAARPLQNVRVLASRGEAVNEKFDFAISRAVSYEDLVKPLKRLAPRAILLSGSEEAPARLGFVWESIPLPWGKQRFLRVGQALSPDQSLL